MELATYVTYGIFTIEYSPSGRVSETTLRANAPLRFLP